MAKNELAVVDLDQLPSTQLGSDDVYDGLSKSADFLGRLQLFTKGKAIDKGLIKPGNYGVPESAEDIIDLGSNIDVLVLARRPKAIDMSDTDALIVSYNPESPEFRRIEAQAQEKESHCMYGPSLLVFERSLGRFLEFFCGSKSTRAESKKMFPFLPLTPADIKSRKLTDVEPHGPLPMTLKSKLAEKGSYSWFVPVVSKCSTPFTKLPASEKIIGEILKFIAPKEDAVERVEEPETKSGKKARAR
jgi:hypothetical protein